MAISAKMVSDLRAKTGCGMMECKKALTEANGDFDEAVRSFVRRDFPLLQRRLTVSLPRAL